MHVFIVHMPSVHMPSVGLPMKQLLLTIDHEGLLSFTAAGQR